MNSPTTAVVPPRQPAGQTGFCDFTEASAAPLRTAITAAWTRSEPDAVSALLDAARLSPADAARARTLARDLAQRLRKRKASASRSGLVQSLLQEYALSSQEGVALMCLAEALLRIPDAATRDALIRDKIALGQWQTHLGKSPSAFVNAATWGLLLTGKLVATHSESRLAGSLGRILASGGEPLIRKGVDLAMRMMGEQFVAGETIDEALANARHHEAMGFLYSYDMLGEAALTADDARRYVTAYEQAIDAIGKAAGGRGPLEGPGISIKLSALHPRYQRSQQDRALNELYPTLLNLCIRASRYDIGLNIDAEEADRLELSLDLLERLSQDDQLASWRGLGFVVQAYQKRCPMVLDYLIDLARRSGRRLMVRLVKGAYWDSEIKRAQVDGLDDYPVYTRKPHTDAAYLASARKLLAAPDAIYPQFATHNAHTLAAIAVLAGPERYHRAQYEFQCLHGMGEPLYEAVVGTPGAGRLGRPCRIYAPVGTHETLLAYLVRRLLENGANTSFVNRIADPDVAIDDLVRDPVDVIESSAARDGATGLPHPAIPLPGALYGNTRRNARGLNLANEAELRRLAAASAAFDPDDQAEPVHDASAADVDAALAAAAAAAERWANTAVSERARLLEAAADLFEASTLRLLPLLAREAGKTAANAVAEVREAVDFLRYYASEIRCDFDHASHRPLGVLTCISPWNFPLAIFTGQVAAALAAGNVVLAKPAEQTPQIAAEAVRMLWAAGIARDVVQLLPGAGEVVGARLVADARVDGVLFTGSTEVARILQATVAGRMGRHGQAVALIAETGGQNAMIVDSSALPEQVVADVLLSAFDSAGQRCSALRVLCLQTDIADRILEMLLGAMAELRVGSAGRFATDVGPVIDSEARDRIEDHIRTMQARGYRVHRPARLPETDAADGVFVAPAVIELDGIDALSREVFGPVLHVVRYERDRLDDLMAAINRTGYGLTLGLHTRIDETIEQVVARARAGNLYVNRNMIGAVVGVQPFGGEGLSGTGPKAGGPLYLYRLLATKPDGVLRRVVAHVAGPHPLAPTPRTARLAALASWADQRDGALGAAIERLSDRARAGTTMLLPGPTGERNSFSLHPRSGVLCLAQHDSDRLLQLAAVLAVDAGAVWPRQDAKLRDTLPAAVRDAIRLVDDWRAPDCRFDVVLMHGGVDELQPVQRVLARRPGPIVAVERLDPGQADIPLERLVIERTLSINTAAAGGNASLMTIA